MNFLDELLGAKTEFLQDEWDKWLLDNWKARPSMRMKQACRWFCDNHKLTFEELNKLKRTPRHISHSSCSLSRYIAAYLPTLNTHLWNGNKTPEELLVICQHQNLLMKPADAHKVKDEARARTKNYQQKALDTLRKIGHLDNNAAHGRRNWRAAKP